MMSNEGRMSLGVFVLFPSLQKEKGEARQGSTSGGRDPGSSSFAIKGSFCWR